MEFKAKIKVFKGRITEEDIKRNLAGVVKVQAKETDPQGNTVYFVNFNTSKDLQYALGLKNIMSYGMSCFQVDPDTSSTQVGPTVSVAMKGSSMKEANVSPRSFSPGSPSKQDPSLTLQSSSPKETISGSSRPQVDCPYGEKCHNIDCWNAHPPERPGPCELGAECQDFTCEFQHSNGRRCAFKENCFDPNCEKVHPPARKFCEAAELCEEVTCKRVHPPERPKPCRNGEKCWKLACLFLHPPARAVCPEEEMCSDVGCTLLHPPLRPQLCKDGLECLSANCQRLHPDGWDVCEEGANCVDSTCQSSHPPKVTRLVLKTLAQREQYRASVNLPILGSKATFCKRLKDEKILVVRAETGSGKTTQLPQYAAEEFGGLIVCTQPRVMAAISIARRVAEEFDGQPVGYSVGYQVGGGSSVQGSRILFVTDATLVNMAQDDPLLKKVSVLMIDEAHERSLNTDLVLGIAKEVRRKRPDDFRVVVASATIDPRAFLDFFGSGAPALDAPGKVFPVELEYRPPHDYGNRSANSRNLPEYVASEVLKAMESVAEGHALVFLSGQAEIEKVFKIFTKRAPSNCTALPLYGSLPPEEQDKVLNFDDENGEQRMVVFCTNVAETSLTVPNVKLVIDTGLAKESRYDTKRMIKVLEEIRISRASADQRKGRAGRTSAGKCIRLYRDDELQNPNITPEILRSSLEAVVLTVKRLSFDPFTFPFIDPPQQDSLLSTIEQLKNLDCLDKSPEARLTARGKLFSELPFDPALSSVVLFASQEYDQLDLALEIASILSAPGSIFFVGGRDKKAKSEAKSRVAESSFEHESDLLHLHAKFSEWKQAQGLCRECQKKKKKAQCKKCRGQFAREESLNNKVLDVALQTSKQFREAFKSFPSRKKLQPGDPLTIEDILAVCFQKFYSRQIGEILVPEFPSAGLRMPATDIKSFISDTSSLSQKIKPETRLCVAFSLLCLPSGAYVADNIHPLTENSLALAPVSDVNHVKPQRAFFSENASKQIFLELDSALKENTSPWARWAVLTHDPVQASLCLHAPADFLADAAEWGRKELAKIRKTLLKEHRTEYAASGSLRATFSAGMKITDVSLVNSSLRFQISKLPHKNLAQFRQWLATDVKLSQDDLLNAEFVPRNQRRPAMGFAVVRNEQVAQKLRTFVERNKELSLHATSSQSKLGRRCIGAASQYNSESQLQDAIKGALQVQEGVEVTMATKISLQFFPLSTTSDGIRGLMPFKLRQMVFLPPESRNTLKGYIQVDNEKQVASCVNILASNFPSYGTMGPRVAIERTATVTFATLNLAEKFEAQRAFVFPGGSFSEEVMVENGELHPLDFILGNLRGSFPSLVIERQGPSKIRLKDTPRNLAKATELLTAAVAPLELKATSRKLELVLAELKASERLAQWGRQLGVRATYDSEEKKLVIQGNRTMQGQLMSYIGDYSDEFDQRYSTRLLSAEVATLFKGTRVGGPKLKALSEKLGKHCTLTFLSSSSEIEVYLSQQSKSDLSSAVKAVEALLESLGAQDHQQRKCNQGHICSLSLQNCGHPLCVSCLEVTCQNPAGGAICCLSCGTPVSMKEIVQCLSQDTVMALKKSQVEAYIQSHQEWTQCPNVPCFSVFPANGKCEQCLGCGSYVCPECSSIDNPDHFGLTCREYQAKLAKAERERIEKIERERAAREKTDVSFFFQEARKFVQEKWPPTMPRITGMQDNTALLAETNSYQRFMRGVGEITRQTFASRFFFAWHGTPEAAIIPICSDGFDPKRRSGQVHGPGEYFGWQADVSHGYCRGGTFMIVALILQGPFVTQRPGFCYVVNNPTDWNTSYALPVLVVNWSNNQLPMNYQPKQPSLEIPHSWAAPFRWYWQEQDGKFYPYKDQENQKIEEAYGPYLRSEGASSAILQNVIRFLDDKPGDYRIDFTYNRQTKLDTGFTRAVERRKEPRSETPRGAWMYLDSNNQRVPFDSLVQGQIEMGYIQYLSSAGPATVILDLPGRPERYSVNFCTGEQINLTSSTVRKVIRM